MKLLQICFKRMVLLNLALIFQILISFANAGATPNPKISVTIAPLHSIIQNIMDGVGQPTLLLSANVSPHDAVLKPSQARQLAHADLVFWVGPQLETFLIKPIFNLVAKLRHISIVENAGVELLRYPSGAIDPHLWLSTNNAGYIAEFVTNKLTEIDPIHRETYRANLNKFMDQLLDLEMEIKTLLEPVKDLKFLVDHDSLGYFTHEFSLHMKSVGSGNEELTLSAKRVASIRKLALTGEYSCLLSQHGGGLTTIENALSDSSVKIKMLDPLGVIIKNGRSHYFDMMRNLAKTIASCR